MTKAFIVNLDTGSDTDFITLATEIQDALEKEGMHVLTVNPWSSPESKTVVQPDPAQQQIQPPPPPSVPPSILG